MIGSEEHFMGDFDETALSWLNEDEKFKAKKSITGFSDVSDIYCGEKEKRKRSKFPYFGWNTMPDDQGNVLEESEEAKTEASTK